MTCTQVHESVDPHAWLDNYICLPPTSPYSLAWAASENGKNSFINDGYACVQIHESADPHAWTDNHLCYRSKDNTNDQFVSSAQPKTHLAGRFAGVV